MNRKPIELSSAIAISLLGALLFPQIEGTQKQQESDFTARWERKDPADVLGYESCRKCHQQQIETLTRTSHFLTYETLHRSAASKAICKSLGIRSVKRSERCVRCHYTPEVSKRGVKAQSGISCESCHGPAQNWIKGHNDYGD